ncbi:hypothetical protein Jann_3664 [Jannaschia sp. CCS1]|nr:hypothetical protein Jann_3664 [Jannaschia sp. CCS1]
MSHVTSVPLVAACITLSLFAPSAHAATCADRTQVTEALTDRFGESLYGNAVSNTGEVLEIYSSSENETWTVLVTLPDRGLSCFVASGTGENLLQMQLARM